jgi:beta-barrel assembly-enhancing protease
VEALLFGPGLPATGLRGQLRLQPDGVTIDWPGQMQAVSASLDELSFREIGFGRPGLELRWPTPRGEWLVHVLDPISADRLRRRPEWQRLPAWEALHRQTRRGRNRRALGWSTLALLVLSPLLLGLLLFTQAGRLAEAIVEHIPPEREMQLGRQAFEAMRGDLRLLEGSAAQQRVQELGRHLVTGSRYRYEFHVADDPTLNAFALPGGIIVVHRGLIEATRRPEELAGVLAHEVQHVELRHGTAGIVRELGWRALWTFVSGDWGGTLAGQAAVELGSLKFSRDAEAAADAAGFAALVRAGIDPGGMADFFATMARDTPGAPPAFLSTHPASEEREQQLRERVRALDGHRFTPLDLGPWPP